jgi:HPt (histidine-containing phosphotransfer) domain-containing protein
VIPTTNSYARVKLTLALGSLALCLAPLALMWLGVDLESHGVPLDRAHVSAMSGPALADNMHRALSGSFTHTILEWSAAFAAMFTVVFAFAHYSIKRDATTFLICIALFFAACMDCFHTVAADRLISSSAPPALLVPFTWALCRFFNALILLAGTGIFVLRAKPLRPRPGLLLAVGLCLAALAYSAIHVCAVTSRLPTTMFPAALVKRPYDVVALVLYLIAGVVVLPRFAKRYPSPFAVALWVSAIPQIAAQLYMVLGSTTLYDAAFNIAHFLKVVAYAVPFLGLLLDYVETHRAEQKAHAELQEHRDQLENIVAERTAELRKRNDEIRLILDNAQDGMLIVDRRGVMFTEHSAIVERWFGAPAANTTLFAYLGQHDAELGLDLEVGWEQAESEILPLEVAIGQLPQRRFLAGKHFAFTYQPIFDDAKFTRMLVIVRDVTSEVEGQLAKSRQEEALRIFEACRRDRPGFVDFLAEASALAQNIVAASRDQDIVGLKRSLHTLKGNSAMFGIASVAEACHQIEGNIADGEGRMSPEDLARLAQVCGDLAAMAAPLVDEGAEDATRAAIEITRGEHDAVLDGLARGAPRRDLMRAVAGWRNEPTERRLQRFAKQAVRVAQRLGKEIDVTVESNGARLHAETWSPVWASLSHVLRNAIDHGIEGSEERQGKGKPASGRIQLRTCISNGQIAIEIADDGCGIEWDRVTAKARSLDLPCATREDLVEALFIDGVSTKETVSELSGRGVGMSAARAACRALGGDIDVISEPSRGTLVRCRFPERVAYELGDARRSVRSAPESMAPSA